MEDSIAMTDDEEEQKLQREIEEFYRTLDVDSLSSSGAAETSDRIDFEDCCRVILEGWRLRQNSARPDLQIYNRHLLNLLIAEFGIVWQDDWNAREARSIGLPVVLPTMARRFADLAGPYNSFIEYTSRPNEAEVHLRHKRRLHECEAAFRETWIELFRDLMLLRWP
jgi:hypothetical protein